MEIAIRGYLAASDMLQREPSQWDCILILDSDCSARKAVSEMTLNHKVIQFDDIESETPGKILATKTHLSEAIEFGVKSERLLVTCRAGQSRSAAIAFLITSIRSTPERALEILDPNRHRPNSQIMKLGASVIDEPSLFPVYSKWLKAIGNQPLDISLFETEIAQLLANGVTNKITT